ncbi:MULTISPECIES: glycosyltransferase family 2 protein [unclassified Empedobacter]|uniref:glycosyltransferase family 2 protein n=1 Tax=unclassified Empedobacter TaxID=2643773 RepID=UPI0025B81AF6|nr:MULTISPECIES: glycosyltransferase family 2 protein [unclassified Empedobacter]
MSVISIFTPAYNRAQLLERLYISLSNQTNKSFEWIIVDDGSIDNTEETVREFIKEKLISITYYKQNNAGKHIAINKGVELAKGELFFIVDSDDYLLENAIQFITQNYVKIKDDSSIAGLSLRKGYDKVTPIGSNNFNAPILANVFAFRFKYKIKGDMAEIVKTKVMKQYPFPKIDEERFLTEGLVWNRIGLKYKMLWFPEICYIAEYLEGGLSDNSFKLRKKFPKGSVLFYKELQNMPISLFYKIRANINYWRFAKYNQDSFYQNWKSVNCLYSIIGLPLSLIFLIKDKN